MTPRPLATFPPPPPPPCPARLPRRPRPPPPPQNIVNSGWSSIQGLIRTVPAAFSPLPPHLRDIMKRLFLEIVTVGFSSGLLREGMKQFPTGKPMGDAAAVAEVAYSFVCPRSNGCGVC